MSKIPQWRGDSIPLTDIRWSLHSIDSTLVRPQPTWKGASPFPGYSCEPNLEEGISLPRVLLWAYLEEGISLPRVLLWNVFLPPQKGLFINHIHLVPVGEQTKQQPWWQNMPKIKYKLFLHTKTYGTIVYSKLPAFFLLHRSTGSFLLFISQPLGNCLSWQKTWVA